MERRAAVPCESAIRYTRLKNIWARFVWIWTCDHWTITAAVIMSFLTDLVAILLNILEPLFINCLGYVDSLSLGHFANYYLFFQSIFASFIFITYTNLKPTRIQIVLLWIHIVDIIFVLPYLAYSLTPCFPDAEMFRPLMYHKIYEELNTGCHSTWHNCHRDHFISVMLVMAFSLCVGTWHSLYYGLYAWKRSASLSRRARQLSHSDGVEEELLSFNGDGHPAESHPLVRLVSQSQNPDLDAANVQTGSRRRAETSV